MSPSAREQLKEKYSTELKILIGRALTRQDGIQRVRLEESEKRLKLKLPLALRTYYELAGSLDINREHNILYPPEQLRQRQDKLVFAEENQRVVFWGLEISSLRQSDPEVFQASNKTPMSWYSEELAFSDFILKMWRWQRGLDKGN